MFEDLHVSFPRKQETVMVIRRLRKEYTTSFSKKHQDMIKISSRFRQDLRDVSSWCSAFVKILSPRHSAGAPPPKVLDFYSFVHYTYPMIDHDRLFKELLRTFFVEFLDLFLPAVRAYVEPESPVFLDKFSGGSPPQPSTYFAFGGFYRTVGSGPAAGAWGVCRYLLSRR